MKNLPPYDEYRFFANITCRPRFGGLGMGSGSFSQDRGMNITVSPLNLTWDTEPEETESLTVQTIKANVFFLMQNLLLIVSNRSIMYKGSVVIDQFHNQRPF
jgi:hypothetical protein